MPQYQTLLITLVLLGLAGILLRSAAALLHTLPSARQRAVRCFFLGGSLLPLLLDWISHAVSHEVLRYMTRTAMLLTAVGCTVTVWWLVAAFRRQKACAAVGETHNPELPAQQPPE